MAFNINAQIILEQPKNLNNVAKNISKQLGKVTKIDLKIGNVQQLTNLNKQLTSLNSSLTKLNSNLSSTRGSVGALGSTFNKTATGVNNVGKAQGNLNTQVTRANQALKNQAGLVGTLGKRFGSVAKQAIAFGAISRPIYDLQRALTGAVKDAVAFEREIVRISQVTGKSVSQLNGLTTQITALSKELGISANELAETSRVIAQAGIRGRDLEQVLNALARSTLAPTFGKITDTTEGLIAAFGQFGLKGKDAEAVLGSLNKVSKEFAVEAEDLISVIRRTGGVFAQAAGDTKGTVGALQELTAVFTAVRSTTRESADTIAAGLRTIFSRIQRRSTINFLQQFGVDLTDAQGKFVGIFPAFDQLSKRLDTLIKQGDALTLSAIAEELGGIRQIGKLLPAIAQFDKARKALTEAQKGAVEGLGGDVAKALDTIDNRVKRIRESFNALIRQVFESDAFQGFAKSILNGSQAIIDAASSIFSALEPILPLLTALGTVKLGRAIGGLAGGALGGGLAGAASTVTGSATAQNTQKTAAAVVNQNTLISTTNSTLANMSRQLSNLIQINNSGFNTLTSQAARGRSTVVTGFGGGRRRAAGGAIPKFADGGRVYGPSHAAGGVIAELEGGEYVIPKKYAQGTPRGGVRGRRQQGELTSRKPVGILFNAATEADPADTTARITTGKLKNKTNKDRLQKAGVTALNLSNVQTSVFSRSDEFKKAQTGIRNSFDRAGKALGVDAQGPKQKADLAIGQLFEDFIISAAGISSPGTRNFDLVGSESKRVSRFANERPLPDLTDIKLNLSELAKETVVEKALNQGLFDRSIKAASKRNARAAGGMIQKLATGDIVRANSVGVAILDPDDVADGKAAVSVADIESQLGFNKGTKKGFSGVSKVFKGKNYSIVKQGLNQKTSERFNKVLAEGLIKGVDFAASELSGDLGLGPTTIDQASKTKFIQSQRSALRGDLFEAALSSLSNRGRFDSAVDFARPFDFPNGLKGPFADNFSRLPSKFVDAKSSKEAAPDANIRGKILREIAADVVKQDPTISQKLTQQGGGKKSKSKATGRGFGSLTFASGGEVPVRISNGEMVVTDPKEVAANRGKLQSINKLATGGFASGTIARGPGTGTSDSIYTTLPAGAFVVNAASTKKYLGLRRGGLAGAGRAAGAAQTTGGEAAGAGIGLIFALQSLTAGLGEGSETLSFFINSVATAAFAVQGLGLEFGNIGKTLGNALGKIPGVASGAGDRLDVAKRFKLGFAGRVRAFGGVGGTAAAGVGAAAGGAVIGKIIGDIAGKAIADSFFGEQEELAGFKGSSTAASARERGALEGGISGLGAGAGAGAGIGFVLGGPVGAAIGAAIGGGAGFLIGQAFGEQNAALEQAAFEAAKALQKSGENVAKSLDELEKEFTISGFGDLTKSLGEQQVNFNDAVTKFSNKFNDEITLTSLSLDFTRAIPGIDAAFASLDGVFGTTLSAANEARSNASKAFIEASKLINPDDVKRAKVQLNASLDKFLESFEVEDLAAASASDLTDSLTEAAAAGDKFAQNILKAAEALDKAELQQRAAFLLQSGDSINKAVGEQLGNIATGSGSIAENAGTNAERRARIEAANPRRNDFLSILTGTNESLESYNARIKAINGQISLELQQRERNRKVLLEEAKQRVIVNKALQDTTEELENIIQSLKSPFTDLAFQVETASNSFDVFKANIDRVFAGQGGFQTRGLQAGAFESDSAEALAERERVFSALDNITPGGAAGSRAAQRLRDEGPEIIKQVLEDARDTAASDDERLTPDVLLTRLETAFGNAGFQLPQGVSDVLSGISRQEDGSAIPEKILEDLIKSDQLTKKFGEVFDAAAEGPAKFAEQLNKVIQLSEKRIAVETELLKKQRDLAKAITESRIATEKRTEQILGATSLGAPTGTEIPDAIDRLTRRVVTIAGTSDTGELLSRRGAALGRQAELQQQIEENPALALNEDIEKERVALANEINQTTEALNLLATETEVFSKIIEKANRIGQNIGALESGLEDVIDKVASGDVAGVQQLAIDQATIGAAINGVATIPQALNALKALGQDQNKALVDVVTGIEGSGDALRRTLLSQLGTSLIAGGGLGGEVAGRYLLGILQQEQKAFALDQLQKERAAKQEKLQADIAAQNFEQTRLLRDLNQALSGDAFANAVTKFNDAVNKFVNVQPSEGGVVARANGGSIFKPRGTDTVPAMLTPGEFVVRKSAVDQYGTGMMEAINSGNAQVFAASGGKVGKGVLYADDGAFVRQGGSTFRQQAEAKKARTADRRKREERQALINESIELTNRGYFIDTTDGGTGLASNEELRKRIDEAKAKGPVLRFRSKANPNASLTEVGRSERQARVDQFVAGEAGDPQTSLRGFRLKDRNDAIRQRQGSTSDFVDFSQVPQGDPASISRPTPVFAGSPKDLGFNEGEGVGIFAFAEAKARAEEAESRKILSPEERSQLEEEVRQARARRQATERSSLSRTNLDDIDDATRFGFSAGRPTSGDAPVLGQDVPDSPFFRAAGATATLGVADRLGDQRTDAISVPREETLEELEARNALIQQRIDTQKDEARRLDRVDEQIRKQKAAAQAATDTSSAVNAAAQQEEAEERKLRDAEREKRLADLNSIEDPLERSARRRELDQERRARNRSRARGSEAAASGFAAGPTSAASPGIAGLSSLTDNTVGSRGAEAQKRTARAIAQRYLTSGDISPETATIIKSQIDAAAPRFAGPGVQLYNQGGKVRGFSSGGDVPIMAQDGEFVMSRNAVQRLGVGTLTRMNNGLPTFHNGGPVYKQFGGRISGRRSGSNGPQTSVVINGSDAAKELNNAIITGGETVKQSWQTLFDTVAEGLNSALGQISTIPNQINATIAPVQIEGVGSFTEALAAQIVPKIVEQIAPLIGDNTNGGTTEQGAGV
jgi:TP901 family phage tail tape measure protein